MTVTDLLKGDRLTAMELVALRRALRIDRELPTPDAEIEGEPYWHTESIRAWARNAGFLLPTSNE